MRKRENDRKRPLGDRDVCSDRLILFLEVVSESECWNASRREKIPAVFRMTLP